MPHFSDHDDAQDLISRLFALAAARLEAGHQIAIKAQASTRKRHAQRHAADALNATGHDLTLIAGSIRAVIAESDHGA